MFQGGYLLSELRRRLGRTIVTALGLAIGVGLVIGIVGVSEGLSEAQGSILSPLSAIGTDVLVTRVFGGSPTGGGSAPTGTAAPAGSATGAPGGGFFAGGAGGANAGLNSDAAKLIAENGDVLTDLSKLGSVGSHFVHDFFLQSTLLSFPDAAVTQTAQVPGVASVSAGLTESVEHESGTVPTIVADVTEAAQAFTETQTVGPTAAQQKSIAQCMQEAATAYASGGAAAFTGAGAAQNPGLQKCLSSLTSLATLTFTIPQKVVSQIINPPQTDIQTTNYTAAGIDPATPDQGLVSKSQLVSGTWLRANVPDNVLLNISYANQHSLTVGAGLAINGVTYTVAGLVNPTLTGSIADLYFPLPTLQGIAGQAGNITQILVKVKKASDVGAVASRIQSLLPGATVVTTQSLAGQVTGSLVNDKKLADRLGAALGAIVLVAAFVIAMLLTLSSISKRVREIGTLRALGWSRGRVVRQIVAETAGIGLIGGAVGVVIGLLASAVVGALSPALQAAAPGVATFGGSSASQVFHQSASVAVKNINVRLHAPVHPATLVAGVALAIIGGLIAGAVGALRASRLSPAEALRNVA